VGAVQTSCGYEFTLNRMPKAGVQIALIDTLVDFGAAIEARGSAKWGSPLMTALAFGHLSAAEALVRRGARVDNIAAWGKNRSRAWAVVPKSSR
jgi:hypothetical protein